MKSTATCTIYFEDGTEQTFVNVTHSGFPFRDSFTSPPATLKVATHPKRASSSQSRAPINLSLCLHE